MKKFTHTLVAAAAALVSCGASAHVGVVNLTTPLSASGQSAFAVAGSTNEIQFLIPHGCTSTETVPTITGANLDTTKIEITVPDAIVKATTLASLRPALTGEFGAVSIGAADSSGNVKLTWARKLASAGEANATSADNQLYKISIRLKAPATSSATDYAIKKYQFLTTQYCKATAASGVAEGTEVAMSWGSANSPTLLVLPDKRKGFNKYTLDTSTLGDFTAASGTATLAAKLKSYFGDAAIVWVGKSGYSANATTKAKITALAAKDSSYSELGDKAGASLTTSDTFWVKY